MNNFSPPSYDCDACPRLHAFHQQNRVQYPRFYNGPVSSFGSLEAELLVVGLAPGLKGANQTGRPFTGDYAGIILYNALQKYGFAKGTYNPDLVAHSHAHDADGFALVNCRITNAVRCVPPENKPETSEIKQCNGFLRNELHVMPNLKIILSLGGVSHKAVISALGLKPSQYTFGHGNTHAVSPNITLINSYHTSRYNINTGNLTQAMFDKVVESCKTS